MTKNEKMVMLRAVVTGYVTSEKPFTSVEIANELKALGVWIPNRQVAEFLRENVIWIAEEYGITYLISNIRVYAPKGIVNASCYHTKFFEASSYLSRDIRAMTPDEFEARHGIEAVVSPEETIGKTEIFVNDDGRLDFNFPGSL